MVSYAELESEPWWGEETVSPAMEATGDRWRAHWDVNKSLIGCKGDNNHLKGRHRSRDWTRNSQYCTRRSYGDTETLDKAPGKGNRLRAYDIDGMPASERYAFNRALDRAVRAGLLPCVAEWWGTFDGKTVVGWFQGQPDASADDSHLEHTHIGIWTNYVDNTTQLNLLGDIIIGGSMAIDPADIKAMAAANAAATWAYKIGSDSLGDKIASEWIKRGQLAQQQAEKATAAAVAATAAVADLRTDMTAALTAQDQKLNTILAAINNLPSGGPPVGGNWIMNTTGSAIFTPAPEEPNP